MLKKKNYLQKKEIYKVIAQIKIPTEILIVAISQQPTNCEFVLKKC